MPLMVSCGKGKAVFVFTMMAYRGNGGTALLILNSTCFMPEEIALGTIEYETECACEAVCML